MLVKSRTSVIPSTSVFNEQLTVADIIVASKADQYQTTELDQLEAYLQQKGWLTDRQLVTSRAGDLAVGLLDQPRRAGSVT